MSCRASDSSREASQQSTLARAHQSEKPVCLICVRWLRERTREDIVLCTHQSRCSVFRWASPYLSSRCVLPMTCSAVLYWSHQPRLCGRITSLIFIWSSVLPACLPGRLPDEVCVCDECPSMHPVWVRPHPCVYCTDTPAYVSARAQCIIWRGARKMSECKMSPVTYSVSWLLRSRAGRTQSLFSFSLTCTLLPTNSLNTQNNKHTLVQS